MNAFRYVDVDGALVAPDLACVPATDWGVLYGIGLFETLRARAGRVFRLQEHVQRLLRSAQALHLPMAEVCLPDDARLTRLLEANGLQDARLRLTVTGGTRRGDIVRQHVLISAVPFETHPEERYTRGVAVSIAPGVQGRTDPLAGHKTTCCWPRLQALNAAQAHGCQEALWLNPQHHLAEGSISNLFVVKDQVVRTPPLNTPVLPGITRAVVLEVCRSGHLEVCETPMLIDDLLDADEVFLTSAVSAVLPVVRVERRAIADERPGPLTRLLARAYDDVQRNECGV